MHSGFLTGGGDGPAANGGLLLLGGFDYSREREVELLPNLGEGSHELSSASGGDTARNWTSEPIRFPSEAADVVEGNALELGARFAAPERSHDPTLQVGGRKGDP